MTLMSTSGTQQKHVDMLLALPVLGKAVDATKAFGRTLAEMYQHHLIKNAHGYTCGDIGEAFAEVTDLIYQNGKQVFDDVVKALEDIRLGILERAHELDAIISPIDPPKDLEEAILRDEIKTDMKDPRNCDWSELMKYPQLLSVGRQYRIPASEIGKYLAENDAIYGSIMLLNATEVEYGKLIEGLDYFLGHYFQELAEAPFYRIGLTLTVTDKTTGTKHGTLSTATYPNRYSTVIPVEAPFYYRLGVFAMPREDAAQFRTAYGRVVRR
ncbi:hypothetical protein SPFM1_00113 [Salmonella phage SPFM1]|nr:hypothetical protein SPFM1_00113 [Salmonella phage SPFM1]